MILLKIKKNNILLSFLSLFMTLAVYGQNHSASMNLKNTTSTNFVAVKLPPNFLSYSRNNQKDLRVFSSQNIEIPYWIYTPSIMSTSLEIEPIPCQIDQKNLKTEITFSNTPKKIFDHVLLYINNTTEHKKVTISGSNDQKNWFVISKNIDFTFIQEEKNTQRLLSLDFPKSDYGYFKISLNDSSALPYNIVKIGREKYAHSYSIQDTVKTFSFQDKNISPKKPIEYTLHLDRAYNLNGLSFDISDTYFSRTAHLFYLKEEIYKRKKKTVRILVSNFELNSERSLKFNIPEIRAKDFILVIDPVDNPPLHISKIRFYSNPNFLIMDASLKDSYKLLIGDSTLSAPNYDIAHLTKLNINSLPIIYSTDLKENLAQELIADKPFYQKKIFMWVCIVLAAIVLLSLSVKMVQDMGKEE